MSCSLARWVAVFAVAAGVFCPASSPAQTKLRLSDVEISEASYLDHATGPPQVDSSPSDYYAPMPSSGCGCGSCQTSCDTCCVPRNWASGDYLLWWTKGNPLPPMITTSPAGTPQINAGVLGLPTTTTLFGGADIDDEMRSGMRFTLGHWADPEGTVGIQATYFGVFDDTNTGDFTAGTGGVIGAGGGAPILARPFFNVDPLNVGADSRLISFPGIVDGTTSITSSSEMHSASLLVRQHWRSGNRGRIDLLGGYRFFRLRDGFLVREGLVTTDPLGALPIGTTFAIEDRFLAENDFHGGDLGLIAEFWDQNWSVEFLAKVALGNLQRDVSVSGVTVTDIPPAGGGVATNGGLFALPTNSGNRTSNDFAALPEFGVNLKLEPRRGVALQAGYTLLMLTDVTRSGELIDTTINGTQLAGGALVGAARPANRSGNTTDFWTQGVNFGVTFSR
jgi:hypothetical protein